MTVQELLDKKKIYYKPQGRDYVISCLNPEHDDSNPSMRVDNILGIFNCLSCGYKGNIFRLFGENLDNKDRLRELLKRKIEDVRANSIGLKLPIDAESVNQAYRVSLETLTEFEAFRSLNPDYSGRIVFPIRDLKGRIAGFCARSEDKFEQIKYKLLPQGCSLPLFPLQKLEPYHSTVMLVEGIFDLLNLWDNGYRNVLCCFGTRKVTKPKLELLKILGVSNIDICLDPDEAGQTAAESIKEMAEDLYFNVRNINLRNCDPGDLSPNRAKNLKEKLYG